MIGKSFAATLGQWFDLPVIACDHIHGHIFSFLLERTLADIVWPVAVLSVSGGHNDIYIVDHNTITKVGQTRDDAAGECFDKVARMLGGPYP